MIVFLATFARVFLLAFQSQNVIRGHYVAAALMPFAIAVAEVAMILIIVERGWSSVPYVGAGGAAGATGAMFVHRRWM